MRTTKLRLIFSTLLLSTFSAFAQEITVAAAAVRTTAGATVELS
jgi:hypothetical protein